MHSCFTKIYAGLCCAPRFSPERRIALGYLFAFLIIPKVTLRQLMFSQTSLSLFDKEDLDPPLQERIGPGSLILRHFALVDEAALMTAIETVLVEAPLRHMLTPRGFQMSVAMSNCGDCGWVTDRTGYRYDRMDPLTQRVWPAMPAVLADFARTAAASAGYAGFTPDACLINQYLPGARMGLHQDKDEQDFTQPIVSVSLGSAAVFLFGGMQREDKPVRMVLTHGDVVVWGAADRLRYHGIVPLKQTHHPVVGTRRLNLTFRKAL